MTDEHVTGGEVGHEATEWNERRSDACAARCGSRRDGAWHWGAAWPAPASAGYNNEATFDCFGIAPNTWCLYNMRHSYSYLMGSIFDSGYRVCIKLIRDSDGSTYGTFYCSTGSVNHDYGFSVPLTKPEVKNSEVNPFSSDVHGYAQY